VTVSYKRQVLFSARQRRMLNANSHDKKILATRLKRLVVAGLLLAFSRAFVFMPLAESAQDATEPVALDVDNGVDNTNLHELQRRALKDVLMIFSQQSGLISSQARK